MGLLRISDITLSGVQKSKVLIQTSKLRGGGWNVDDQNVDRPKISERRNGLFSLSER